PAHIPLAFFFQATSTTDIYTLSLHDALPISYAFSYEQLPLQFQAARGNCGTLLPRHSNDRHGGGAESTLCRTLPNSLPTLMANRSEEHTSELQSRENLVCRLLLEKKKKT